MSKNFWRNLSELLQPPNRRQHSPNPTPDTANPAGAPRFVVVIDTENIVKTYAHMGGRFNPLIVRDAARELGTIAFAFAFANVEAIPDRTREELTINGFLFVNCAPASTNGAVGRKDTVDEHIQDMIARFLEYANIDGVILVTDDQNFAPIIGNIRDHGKQCIVLTPRKATSLGRITRSIQLPFAVEAPQTHADWNPEIAIAELRNAARAGKNTELASQAINRFHCLAPFPYRVLIRFLRRFRQTYHADSVGFVRISACMRSSISPEDRHTLPDEAITSFLSSLIAADVIITNEVPTSDGPMKRYAPSWWNPLCKRTVADIIAQEAAGRARGEEDPERSVNNEGTPPTSANA